LGERGEVTLYFEPFILSLECRTLEHAELMTRVAQEAGFRESG
jgi:tRNA(Phe) wybutosine-synthesizing methylase Tyw3